MGEEKPHLPVKLVIPVLFSIKELYLKVKKKLISFYGRIDFESEVLPFNYTNYYDEEMGNPIYRCFLSFERLISPDKLVNIKKQTNILEKKFAIENKRKVNIDPGYMTLAKFILATTKDYQHRIYIRSCIFEEVTLFYRNKKWQHFEWTYPDYRSEEYKKILEEIRKIYIKQLKSIFKEI